MKFLSGLKNKNLLNKTCVLRVDFNIENEELSEKNFRIQAVLPTIKFLTDRGAKIVILSHRGRPPKNPKSQIPIPKGLSLKPFAKILSSLLEKPVGFAASLKQAEQKTKSLRRGDILLIENLRFYPEEEKNDPKFAKKLASLGNLYINDAFGVSHRKDASIAAMTKFLPSYAGLLLEREIKNLSAAMYRPKHPFIVVLGGAKIPDKIGALKDFMGKTDKLLIGGDCAKEVPFLSKFNNVVLPVDYIIERGKTLDIGPKTSRLYSEIIKNAKTIIWNGPMGYSENPKFAKGTNAVIGAISKSHAFVVIGGGETIASLNIKNQISKIKNKHNIFLSTGGGAMLQYLSGEKMPGLMALDGKY